MCSIRSVVCCKQSMSVAENMDDARFWAYVGSFEYYLKDRTWITMKEAKRAQRKQGGWGIASMPDGRKLFMNAIGSTRSRDGRLKPGIQLEIKDAPNGVECLFGGCIERVPRGGVVVGHPRQVVQTSDVPPHERLEMVLP